MNCVLNNASEKGNCHLVTMSYTSVNANQGGTNCIERE